MAKTRHPISRKIQENPSLCKEVSKYTHNVGFPLFQDGAYLVRRSVKNLNHPYTLSLYYRSKVWHLHIRIRNDKMYAIGSEKPEEEVNIVFLHNIMDGRVWEHLFNL